MVSCLIRTALPWNTHSVDSSECPRIVWQPASHFLQGSSIVPERGKICPGAAALLLQIPDDPKGAVPRRMAFRYGELWPPHTLPPEIRRKVKWAGHTRHVASDFMPPATSLGTMGIRGTEGLPS